MANKKINAIASLQNGSLDKELCRLDANQASKILNQNSPNHFGRTVLHLACEHGQYEAVKCCLEFGARPNNTSTSADLRKSPLHVLIQKLPPNTVEITKLLLAYRADPKIVDSSKNTPLDYAHQKNHKQLIQLLSKATSIYQSASGIATREAPVIHKEIENKVEGSNEKIMELLSKCYLKTLSTFDYNNWSLINRAIVNSNFKLAESLVEHTLEIPSTKNPSNFSPLHLLTIFKCTTLFKNIITKFPRLLLSRDNDKNTPLHLACRNGVFELVCLMLPDNRPLQYVDVNATNMRGTTPLHYAAREGHICITEYLLQCTKTNCIDSTKQTFLLKAILSERIDLIHTLLSNHSHVVGQLINYQDNEGRTFLQHIVSKGLHNIVRQILKLNPSVTTVGLLTLQGYKKYKSTYAEFEFSLDEEIDGIDESLPPIMPNDSVQISQLRRTPSNPLKSSNNLNSLDTSIDFYPSSQRNSFNTSTSGSYPKCGSSLESKNSDNVSANVNVGKQSYPTDIPQEHSRNVSKFQKSSNFILNKSTNVTVLIESLLLDDLSSFQLIIDYILEKNIPISALPDFQSAVCLAIRIKKWRAVEILLKLTYNEKIEYEVIWNRLYLTNEALNEVIQDITSFKFLTSTDMVFQNLMVLDIHNNELTEIPSFIVQMKELRRLSLVNNKIENISHEIFSMKELRELNLSGNSVKFIHHLANEPLISLLKSKLDKLELENCGLEQFPPVIEELYKLHDLNLSQNNINSIPCYIWKHKGIRRLNLSRNKLTHLTTKLLRPNAIVRSSNNIVGEVRMRAPRRFSTYYDKRGSRERFQTLPITSDSIPVRSVQRASFEHSIIPGLQFNVQLNNDLSELNLSYNEFAYFPTDMSGLTPTLKKLNMSYNKIQTIYLSLIPYTLIELNLDGNLIDTFSCDDPYSRSKGIAEGTSTLCSEEHDALNWLKNLSINDNKLKEFPLLVHYSENEGCSNIIRQHNMEKRLRFPVLEVLSIVNNVITLLTPEIQYQASIQEIYLDGNAELAKLPYEIGYLKCFNRLQIISVENCPKIGNIPPHIYNHGNINTPLLMPYFRAQLKGSVQNNLVKLMVIGSFNQGKTSLLRRLKGLGLTERNPTKGVEIDSWKCDFGRAKSITFVTWDFAGQEEYYATHQCFLSTGALYILCFSLETFTEDAKSMQTMTEWLQSIELRAPRSPVIIVGTHLDKVSENVALVIKETLQEKFVTEGASRIEQLPHVIDVMLVCCIPEKSFFSKLNKKMDQLKDRILDVVGHLSMHYNRIRQTISYLYKRDADSKSPTLLLNQQTPKDYENLREKLFKVSSTLLVEAKPPILKDSELKSHAEHIIDNPDDLFDAVEHLHMQGSILHFNTPLLKDVYFLDPNWLCKQMARVIGAHTDTNNSNGLVSLVDLESSLKDISQFWNKFVRLLEQFQIMLRFSEEEVLIPSQLPVEPINLVGLYKIFTENLYPDHKDKYFVRIWPLVNVPHGFWPRLLCRVAQDPVIMSLVSKKSHATISIMGSLKERKEEIKRKRIISDANLPTFDSDINWNFWRSGVQLVDKHGEIQFEIIELSQDNPEIVEEDNTPDCYIDQHRFYIEKKFRVLSVVHVQNDELATDCQIFVRITQHINSLFEAWFPGILTDYQVPSYYPCPRCFYQDTKQSVPHIQDQGYSGTFIKFGQTIWSTFTEEHCFRRSGENSPVKCHWHGNIDISRIAPDVKLLDVGPDRVLDMNTIRLGSQLGAGTYGVVYKGEIWDHYDNDSIPCAIKLFVGNTFGRSYDHILEHMSEEDQWNSYIELRKELSPMVNLTHPNLSLLLGVTMSPLQIVMGLARKGSLLTMINKYSEKKAIFHPKIAASSILQIASGLNYLHSNNLVHLDLKAANILVWDFPEPDEQTADSKVLLKLADYGTVLHCDTLGVRMSNLVGTPGYIAPEVVLFSGKQSFTSKADVFSFAMVLYEILSYRPPFVNFDSEHDQKWAPAQGRRPLLRAEEKYSPCLFQDLMTACWTADPDDRPTMEECENIASNPLFSEIRSIMSFEKMVRFASHAVITNTLSETRIPGDSMDLQPLGMEGGLTDSMKRYGSMSMEPRKPRIKSDIIDFGNLLTGENTQIWLGAFNDPYRNKVAIVQYLHGQLGSRVWFVDVLPSGGDAYITVLTSVNKQVWLGTNEGKIIVIDGTCFKKLPVEYSNLNTNEIHAIKHVEIMKKVFISFRSNDVAILEDKLEVELSGNYKFIITVFITTDNPIFTFHPVQRHTNSWEVWGTKDGCTIEVFPQLPNGKLGQNFSKSLSVDPTVKYQRFHCIASCFQEDIPEQKIDGYAVVWISEWQRATAYVMGVLSRSLRAGVPIPKDLNNPDAIKEISSMYNKGRTIYLGVSDGHVYKFDMVSRQLLNSYAIHQTKVRKIIPLPALANGSVCAEKCCEDQQIVITVGNGFYQHIPSVKKSRDLCLVAFSLS
ncbi:hypothetical protein LOD99_14734 [Oopsacas minuta]|uniref:non-specific serine/threonine protein kinase n=1 Tax=Oopsacas minuta TaxID=111878 RepID=A0AAV7KCX2_9METZ|nr:hypothetical protein LOD99_14734 [Oopsacas minuta]